MGETCMDLSQWTDEYVDAIDKLLDFPFGRTNSRDEIVCSFKKCNNILWQPCEPIYENLRRF